MSLEVVANPPRRNPWHVCTPESVLEQLHTDAGGLTDAEAANRLSQYGPNELQEKKPPSRWATFIRQFRDFIIWVLIVAGVVSAILGETADAIAILAIVVLNALIGFYQEFSAEQSIAALRKMTAPRADVWREGRLISIPAAQVVPGDILDLEAGDLVAADARLIVAHSFRCIESALTGESEAVDKRAVTLSGPEIPLADRENVVFMGTTVANGTARAVVVATGMESEIGRIASLIREASAEEDTPLQRKLESFGRILVWASLAIVATLFVLGLVRGIPFLEIFMTAVSLAVAAVPEGLPAVVTIALALGVLRMSRRRALVRRLPAVETLGSTTVICTDKTGTLTVGEMTVRRAYVAGRTFEFAGEGYAPHGGVTERGAPIDSHPQPLLTTLANVLVGCNNAHLVQDGGAWSVVGDPTEGAMLSAAAKAGITREKTDRDLPLVHEIPFDSDRKLHTVIRRTREDTPRAFVNGAPEILVTRCSSILTETGVRALTPADLKELSTQNTEMAASALRVIGSAYRDLSQNGPDGFDPGEVESDLVFVGLTGMYDPPRPEVKDAIARCHEAGIRVVMITGDQPRTAVAIARELGLAKDADLTLSGAELQAIDDRKLQELVLTASVYARVTAEHKLRIVRAWQANGAVVAMTGDGVNDAPAIKGADIGIAMGRTGTEVTKQASDMIITDDNFASIVAAVEEGRGIYANIRKTLQYLLAGNTGELLLMTVCIVAGLPTPLLPIHLLWINLVTDGLPAICLATDPVDRAVMRQPPRAPTERITDRGFLPTMLLTGFLTAGVSFAVYLHGLQTETHELARTHAFAVLVFAELLRSFGARSEIRPVWKMSLFSNVNLLTVVAFSFLIQVWSHHSPWLAGFLRTSLITLGDCMLLLGISTVPLIVLEAVKLVRIYRPNKLSCR